MRNSRGLIAVLCALGGALALAGCTATHPSAVRVNSDGSADYVTCVADADDWDAYFYVSENDDESIDLQPVDALVSSAEGVVVHFSPPDEDWDRLVIGASYSASVVVRSDSFTPDEWQWNTDGWFRTGTRCSIEE